MSEVTTEGPLSVDQAIANLAGPPPEVEAPEAEPETEALDETESEDATTSDEPVSEDDSPGDEGDEAEDETEAVAPVDAPAWWKADAKAKFAELPSELQAVVLEQETVRERVVSEAKAQAAETVKAAQKEMEGVQALADHLNDFLPQAIETFKSRWGEAPDWAEVVRVSGAEEAFILKAQWEQEQAQIVQLKQATAQAEVQARHVFLQNEFKTLAEIAPDLTDPTTGAEKRTAITLYLDTNGIDREAINNISAREMLIAHKAMLWDQAQATSKQLATKPQAKPPQPAKTPVRPGAAVAPSSPQRTAQSHRKRFAQTRSVEDAIALLVSKG
jgi:hypothetical protein